MLVLHDELTAVPICTEASALTYACVKAPPYIPTMVDPVAEFAPICVKWLGITGTD